MTILTREAPHPAAAGSPTVEAQTTKDSERSGPMTMSLLWLTMVASFPSVLIGFEWYRLRLSFTQVLLSLVISIGILLLYSIPVCMIAERTGLSFKLLCAKLFSPTLSRNLTLCLIFIYLGWYAVVALFMADAYCGIAGGKQYLPLIAFAFSFAMAFNNFFGFKGVANFARFVGAPAVICWVVYMFIKVVPEVPVCLKESHDVVPFSLAFCSIAQFIVGFAIWGNEADYWRNCKSKPLGIGIALAVALIIGEIVFPLTGWVIAAKTGITESAVATAYLNKFTFGGAGMLALLFLGAQYFAANDSNLYAFAHAVESFTRMTHKKVVFALAVLSGLLSVGLTVTGTQSALESMCTLNSVLLPTATVIVIAEWFIFRSNGRKGSETLPVASRSVLLAWSAGAILGIVTSGIIPGTKSLNVGIPALQAWILALAVYLPLRAMELSAARQTEPRRIDIGLSMRSSEQAVPVTVDIND